MCFSSCRRRLTSAPYLPTVPSSTRRKWECRLLRTFSLLRGLSSVWYGAIICSVDTGRGEKKMTSEPSQNNGRLRDESQMRSSKVFAYISADEIIPVFDDSPGSDPDSANFLWGSWAVLFESISHVFGHTCQRNGWKKEIFHLEIVLNYISTKTLQKLTLNLVKI